MFWHVVSLSILLFVLYVDEPISISLYMLTKLITSGVGDPTLVGEVGSERGSRKTLEIKLAKLVRVL